MPRPRRCRAAEWIVCMGVDGPTYDLDQIPGCHVRYIRLIVALVSNAE
jgi:hypothetical protein